MLDDIWSTLLELVRRECSREEWARFRRRTEEEGACEDDGGFQYRAKTAELATLSPALAFGPFAHYVRECSVQPDEAMHDYLDCPEIVQDIARCFRELYGIDLESRYRKASVPCVVKFRVAGITRDAVEAAVSYAFWMLREGTSRTCAAAPSQRRCLPRTSWTSS
jgi:hypothetical protein